MIRKFCRFALFVLCLIGLTAGISSAQTETILHDFGDGSVASDGTNPTAALIQGTDGNFYGITGYGGTQRSGTAFKMTPSGAVTILHDFGDGTVLNDGTIPAASLIRGNDGNFYGTTRGGGSTVFSDPNGSGYGTVFKMTPSGTVTILHSFGDGSVANDGHVPSAALVQGIDSNFYGTTYGGGTTVTSDPQGYGYGTVFKMTPSGTVTILHDFQDGSVLNDGREPSIPLIQGSDGYFYGATASGGSTMSGSNYGYGTVFKMTSTGALTIVHSFGDGTTANDGTSPDTGLTQGSDGNFYGATTYGGASAASGQPLSGYGTVFKMTPSGTVTTLHSFGDGSVVNDGRHPDASLVQGSDGNLYGITNSGGSTLGLGIYGSGYGTIFQMSPSGVETIVHDFYDGSVANDGDNPAASLVQDNNGNFYGVTPDGGTTINSPASSGLGYGVAFKFSLSGTTTLTWRCCAVSAVSGSSRLLWTRSDGATGLWSLNASGVQSQVGPVYGPYTGWSAVALATASDGTSRILWTNADGRAGLWSFSASDLATTAGPTYGPYAEWTARAVGVAADGTARVLWSRSGGTAGLWSFNASDVETVIGSAYGSYPGWSAVALATASNGVSRVLWDNANGQAGVWSFGTNDTETVVGPAYGPYANWTASAVGAASDGTARVMWTNTNGQAGLWSFNADDTQTLIGTTYGPYPGYGAISLGTAADGTSEVLWDRLDGAAGVWSFGSNDIENVIGSVYGPY